MPKKYINKIREVFEMAKEVRKQTGRNYVSQTRDIFKLCRANATCRIWDYYKLGIYQHKNLNARLARSYLGYTSLAATSEALNPRHAVTAAWDKLVFDMIAQLHDLPTARNVAVFKPGSSLPKYIPHPLHTRESLVSFLSTPSSYPLFIKPVHAQQNIGGYYLNNYNQTSGKVSVGTSSEMTLEQLIDTTIDLQSPMYDRGAGYLFQTPITQHALLTSMSGTSAPSGLRFIVLQDQRSSAPTIHRCIMKLVRPGNYSDNFHGGSRGNMVARIDPATGALSHAVTGYWPFAEILQHHPTTGYHLPDLKIPMWSKIVDTVLKASRVFATMKILHWDVMVGPEGPVLLELNDLGGTSFVQLHGTGFMDDVMTDFMRRNGKLKNHKDIRRLIG
ncbi:MAG: hypothetical protein CME43_15000 [Haliea sp.]|uniref:sugar-transfer associated ATP-grasp domain-containing protein n=1 Tax=Haliea sp. TaxID=1932666 RepID=UPI000C5C41DA|nr:sugar-transfer associated ATP-grasp domain-containing protein [Haliea sp.]MBM70775.1 hypothetical protein [Haliea sp.]|tara:strand:- start:7005 stop:8171 length:1167 start_codon:yes stop_codon:yes gene_type:complete